MTTTMIEMPATDSVQEPRQVSRAGRVENIFDRLRTTNHPVIVVAVAAAIVIGAGFVAYLTAQCIAAGCKGFGAVISIDWNNGVFAVVGQMDAKSTKATRMAAEPMKTGQLASSAPEFSGADCASFTLWGTAMR